MEGWSKSGRHNADGWRCTWCFAHAADPYIFPFCPGQPGFLWMALALPAIQALRPEHHVVHMDPFKPGNGDSLVARGNRRTSLDGCDLYL